MKKIFSFAIAAMMMFALSTNSMAATQDVTFTVGNVTVEEGTASVVVPVTVSSADYPLGLSMFEGYVEADAGLTLTDISGDVSGNTSLGNGDAVVSAKKAYICDDDFIDVMAEGAVVFNLTFTIDDPTVAKTYAVAMSDDTYAYDEEASEEHNITLVAGSVTVKGKEVPKTDVEIDDVNDFDYTDVYVEDGVEKKHAAFEVAFTVAENNNPVTALNVTGTKTAKVALKTAVTSGTCNVFINVLGVPADATLGTITVAPVAE